MARLDLWQRLGVVLSILWIFGAGYWSRMIDIDQAREWKNLSYRKCLERFPDGVAPDRKACILEAEKVSDLFLASSWENIAIFIFGTLIAAWIAGYIVFRTTRWVLAGRNAAT